MAIELQGIDKVLRNLEKINRKVEANLSESLKKGGDMVLDGSRKITPIDTGRMIQESDVKKITDFYYQVRYNEDYALYVHEDLEASHPSGQAKFLQTATNDKGREVIKNIGKELLK